MSLVGHVLEKSFVSFINVLKSPVILGIALLSAIVTQVLRYKIEIMAKDFMPMGSYGGLPSMGNNMALISGILFTSLIVVLIISFLSVCQIQFISENAKSIEGIEYSGERNLISKYLKVILYIILTYLFSAVIFGLVIFIIAIVGSVSKLAAVVLSILSLVLLVWLSIRLSQMVFMIVVDNDSNPIGRSFEITEGKVLKIILIYIVGMAICFVVGILGMILNFAGVGIIGKIIRVPFDTVIALFMINMWYIMFERLKELSKIALNK